jgi:4Fe-4S binding domain
MLGKISEKYVRLTRMLLAISWSILIVSMFYDPISFKFTAADQLFGPNLPCFQFQGQCLPTSPYRMGARIFWGMIIPLVICLLLVFGHEGWRRICPLSFFSQLPRTFGMQGKRIVKKNSWLDRNVPYFQFCFLFLGLCIRLLFVNSDRLLLGYFLSLTIIFAIGVGFLFNGKFWCHYICPMGPVQEVLGEPSGLFARQAPIAPPKSISQSMCRKIDSQGHEKSACVGCKSPCLDIDGEAAYWASIREPHRKILMYGYVGLVIGFYGYFGLYSGNWNLLSVGVWNETNQLATLMNPGFFIAGKAIGIPKILAVPLTLGISTVAALLLSLWIEKLVKRFQQHRQMISPEYWQSRAFAIAKFIAFNLLFFMGIRPTLDYFSPWIRICMILITIVASTAWLIKIWKRSPSQLRRKSTPLRATNMSVLSEV